jgi:hypothetical protein
VNKEFERLLKEFEENLKRFNEIPLLIQDLNKSLLCIDKKLGKIMEDRK